MLMRLLAYAILIVLTTSVAGGQVAPYKNLQLRLIPGVMLDGVPLSFTFEIVNLSDHDVRVPRPAIQCGTSYNGYLWLQLNFTPLNSTPTEGTAFGCFADQLHWPSILERVKEWQVLHPGDVLRETASGKELHFEVREPGTYEFWADYTPPIIDPKDQATLREASIDFLSTSLTSAHLTFQKLP